MNLYHKINKNILERFPTMWNTHFVWMILICLLTHALYFGLGYSTLNIEILKDYGVRNAFFKNGQFSIYLIIGLLALIFFGFRYFTHNPFKNFYPVSKIYFWKILGQLFIIFTLYGSVIISFENGMKLRAKKIAPIETVQKEADQIAFAKPFLYNDISDYYIKNRSYPEPFPCDDVQNLILSYDSLNEYEIKHGIDYQKPYVSFERGDIFQFGKLIQKRIDSCKTKEVLDTIYDVSKIYGLAQYSLYNYSGTNLSGNRKHISDVNFEEDETDLQLEKIHNWYKNKDSVSIAKTIQGVKDICKKYQINEMLNPMKMASGGLKQDLNVQQLIRTGFEDYEKYNSSMDNIRNGASAVTTSVDGINSTGKTQIEYNYFADLPEFNYLKENVETLQEEMGTKQLSNQSIWVLIFSALFGAFFLVMVKYIPFKDLIIGVFVGLVLVALLALYVATTERFEDGNSEMRVLRVCLIYAGLVMGIGFYGFYSNAIKKALLTKWFVGFGAATIAFFPALFFYIQQKSYKEVFMDCQQYPTKIYNFEMAPWHFFGLGLVSVFIIFTMLRKLYAKVE